MSAPNKIAVFLGHPDSRSFCGALADSYAGAAKQAGREVRFFKVGEMAFDPLLDPRDEMAAVEPDLKRAQEALVWAEHLVFVFPTWWFNWPARFKGLVDRLFRAGLAFEPKKDSPLPKQLLKGRSARLIVTAGGPNFYYWFIGGNPAVKAMKMALGYCGVGPVRSLSCGTVDGSRPEQRNSWLAAAADLGRKGE